mgnify:CR=1 FL=1|jgi:hypothetical protein
MITIEDHDTPIQAAAKIIYGMRPLEEAEKKSFFQTLNIVAAPYEVDMFDINELQEIAEYISAWCRLHKEDERCSN